MAPSLPKRKCISSKKQKKSSVDKISILKKTSNTTTSNLTKPSARFSKLPNVQCVNEVSEDKHVTNPTVLYLSPADKSNEFNPSTLVKPRSSYLTLKEKISTRSHGISESSKNQAGFSHICDALSSVQLINSTYETDHSKIPAFTDKEAEKMQDSDNFKKMISNKKMKSDRKQVSVETRKLRCKKSVVPTCIKSPVVNKNCPISAESRVTKIPTLEIPVKCCKNNLKSTTKHVTSKNVAIRKIKMKHDGNLKGLQSVNVKKNKSSFIAKRDAKKQKIRQKLICEVCNFPKSVKNQHLDCLKCNSSWEKSTDLLSKQLLKKASHALKAKSKISSLNKCSVREKDNNLKNNSIKICKKLNKSVSSPKFKGKLNMQESSNLPLNESVGVQCVKKKKCAKIPSKTKTVGKQHASDTDSNACSKGYYFKIKSKDQTSALLEVSKNRKTVNGIQNLSKKKVCQSKILSSKKKNSNDNLKKKIPKVNLKIKNGKIAKQNVKKWPSDIEITKKHKLQAKKKGLAKVSIVKMNRRKVSPQITKKCCTKVDVIKMRRKVSPQITKKCCNKVDVIKKNRGKGSIQITKCPSKVSDGNKDVLKAENRVAKQHLRKRPYKLLHSVPLEVVDSSKSFMNQYASIAKKRKWDSVEDECEKNPAKRNISKQLCTKTKQQAFSKQVKKEPSENSCSGAVLNKFSDSQTLNCMKSPSVKYEENSNIESPVCSLSTPLEYKDHILELAAWNNFKGCSYDVSTPSEAEEMLGVTREEIITFKCDICDKTYSCTYCAFVSHIYCHFNEESDEKYISGSNALKPLIESVVSLAFSAGCPRIKSVVSLASQCGINIERPLSGSLTRSSSLVRCNILKKQLITFYTLQKLLKPILSDNCFYFEKDFNFKFEDKNFIFNKRFAYPNIIQNCSVYALEQKEKLKEPSAQKPSSDTCASQIEDEQKVKGTTENHKILQDTGDCSRLSVSQYKDSNSETNNCNPTNSANKKRKIDIKRNVEYKIHSSEVLHEVDNEHNSMSISKRKKICTEIEGRNPTDSASKEVHVDSKGDTVNNEHSSRKEESPSALSFNPKQINAFSVSESKSNYEHTITMLSCNSDNDHNVLCSEQKSHVSLPTTSTTEIITNVGDVTFGIRNIAGIDEEYNSVKETIPAHSYLISEKSEADIMPCSCELNEVLLETNCVSNTENAEATTSAATSEDNTELQVTDLPATAENNLKLPEVTSTRLEIDRLRRSLRFPLEVKDIKLTPFSELCSRISSTHIRQLVINGLVYEAEEDLELIQIFVWLNEANVPTRMCCAICYATVYPNQVTSHLCREHSVVKRNTIRTCFLPEI